MHPPASITPQLFSALDLDPVVEELLARANTAPDGKAARTLFKSAELTVLVIALRAGATLSDHAAKGPIAILPLRGTVRFQAAQQSKDAELAGKMLLVMGTHVQHAVVAEEDAAFMLTLGSTPSVNGAS